jgi:acetyltransferase-like isoleucine patch superfamily enzyme
MYFLIKKLKHILYRLFIMPIVKTSLKKCGKKVYVGERFRVNAKRVTIGDFSTIGTDANILCTTADVVVGKHVMISHGLTLITGRHRYNIVGKYMQEVKDSEKEFDDDAPIFIEDDVWIAANVSILRGVTIGRGSIIGYGSIVTRNVNPYSIVVGNPAKEIKKRFSQKEINQHNIFLDKM